jgi:hypothetical protein
MVIIYQHDPPDDLSIAALRILLSQPLNLLKASLDVKLLDLEDISNPPDIFLEEYYLGESYHVLSTMLKLSLNCSEFNSRSLAIKSATMGYSSVNWNELGHTKQNDSGHTTQNL